MKQLWTIGIISLATVFLTVEMAAQPSSTTTTTTTTVQPGTPTTTQPGTTTTVEKTTTVEEGSDRHWRAYNACELEFLFFGTGTVGSDSDVLDRDGKLGAGAGLAYFFHRNIGIEAYAYSESTSDHFVDTVNGDLVIRFPIMDTGLAPYGFGGGGRAFDPVTQWTWDAGGGLQWRFLEHLAVFADARYVWADKTKDYGLGRVGLKVGF
jgi:hypothetical protein